MKKIAFVFIAAMAVLSFTGCKKKGGAGEAIAKMEGFKNEMCKCADKACAEKVSKSMEEYGKSMGDKDKMMKDMSEDDKKKAAAVGEEMAKCMMKLMAPAMDGAGGDMKKPEGGDKPADGAKPADGDKPADGAKPADGDKKMDGDKPADGAKPADGDKK